MHRYSSAPLLVLVMGLCACGVACSGSTPPIASAGLGTRTSNNSATTATDAWPSFRGPEGNGRATDSTAPLEWNLSQNLKWKRELPGAGSSSPIVWNDRVYITSYSGYFVPGEDRGDLNALKRHLLAIDRNSGEVLWDQAIDAKLPEEEQIRDHGYAASTPAADAEHVYAFFGKSGVFAFTHEGEQVWSANVGSGTHGWGSGSSPMLVDDLVIINASVESGSLIALDRATGEERWKVDGVRESWNTPIVATAESGRRELVFAIQGSVWGLNPSTGERYWECNTDIGWYMVPSIVAQEGVVYCLGGRSGITALAVRMGGSGNVTQTHRIWTSQKGTNVTSPIVFGEHLYWMQDQQGIAYCARLSDGEIVYEERMNRAGQVYASAVLVGDKIIYTTREGQMYVVAAKPEFELLSTNELRDRGVFDASPAVAGEQLFFRSHKVLYCIQE